MDWHFGYSPIHELVLSLDFRMRVTKGKLQAGDDALEAVFYPLDQLPLHLLRGHRKFINLETGLEL